MKKKLVDKAHVLMKKNIQIMILWNQDMRSGRMMMIYMLIMLRMRKALVRDKNEGRSKDLG
jgi:hypothetical protein